MACIPNGSLWTCHHVGLDGIDGTYEGDSSGSAVDRTAIQWFKLQINPTGNCLEYETHGRIFDPNSISPQWYYYPSLMVNAAGDMVAGFGGSSETSFLSAFYYWRLQDGTSAESARVLKAGEDLYWGGEQWGDYTFTSLDPSDSLSFWTVQQYSKKVGLDQAYFQQRWGTWIARIFPHP
jgi:hypothetical protein